MKPDQKPLDKEGEKLIKNFFGCMKKEEEKKEERVKIERFFMVSNDNNMASGLEQFIMKQDDDIEQKLIERILKTEQGSTQLTKISDDMLKNYNDGKRIFVNRLRFYKENAIEEHMLSFKQLMYKDLGFKSKMKGNIEVTNAILSTMVFEIEMIDTLIKAKIPITVFLERNQGEKGSLVEYATKINTNFVFQNKFGVLGYGVFHSKIMLLEFDDRLRVVIPSANLYVLDWEMLSQVIWLQDFPKKTGIKQTKEEQKESEGNDFKEYLTRYMEMVQPKNFKKEVFRQSINLDRYDFSKANASLLASVNGRYHSKDRNMFGQNRFASIINGNINDKEKTVTYQTSSLGKLVPKFMTSLYEQFGHKLKEGAEVQKNFRIIFPTDGYVQSSHLGSENASSIILNTDYWYSVAGFPRKAFCKQVGRTKDLDKNLYHAKFMIVTEKGKEEEITDETVLYFGSHNLSAGAWGNLEKDGNQISIANWEIGVVFGPKEGSKEMKQKMVNSMVLKYPPEKYGENDYPFMFN